MPKKRPKLRKDENELAFDLVRAMTGEGPRPQPPGQREAKNPEAVARGSKGGKKGGAARAKKLTPEKRREVARAAALKRWRVDPRE